MAVQCWPRGKVSWIILLLFSFTISGIDLLSYQDDVRNEFLSHSVVRPMVTPSPSRQKRQALQENKYAENLIVNYTAFGEHFILDLHINRNLLPAHYFEKYHQKGKYVLDKPYQSTSDHCYYQGEVQNKSQSWAAVSLCNGVSGMIFDGEEVHYIEPKSSTLDHLVFKAKDAKNKDFKCGFDESTLSKSNEYLFKLRRTKRESNYIQEPYKSNSESRFVELVIVNDNQEFKERNSSKEAVFERSKQIANIVNSLYAPLNIFIALVGVIIWSEYDEIKLSPDGDATLTNFLHYRRQRLTQEHPNDNAQLITAMKFDGGVVGKALKGPICTWEFSGGVNMDHSKTVGLVATTVAHELGHNFGMEHDSDECKCPDDKCIMSPSSGTTSPKHWSSCSKEYLKHALSQGMDYCLRNAPEKVIGPVCGNGFIEPGETCDCGYKEFCDSKCCNATTCQLLENAVCATGSCCNLDTCQLKRASLTCRNVNSECDLPEFCDGISEFCPRDVYLQDGTDCGNGKAYCYEGNCQSHDDQCKLLWGSSGKMSDQKCFEQNQNGNDNGNCGYFKPNKTFKACRKSDVLCGRLHCIHLNERLEFGLESAATLAHSFIQHKSKTVICRSATVDLGLDTIDPGLAPNGAICGSGRACFQQACQPVSAMKSPSSPFHCNYNGVCNNKGNCHCVPGFNPPLCNSPGPGGSIDSGPASDPEAGYQFLVAMYVIFLCIVPLTVIAAFGIYYFRRHLKTWWISKARKAAIKSRAKQATQRKPRPPSSIGTDLRKVEISSPLPADPNPISATSTLSRSSSGRGTLSRSSFRNCEISPPIPQSSTNDNVGQLIPVRPAPPRPHAVQRTPSWAPGSSAATNGFATVTRSASVRTTGENGRPLSGISRPHCPPPPRPPPPKVVTSNLPIVPSATTKPQLFMFNHLNEEERFSTPNSLLCNGSDTLDFSDTPLAFVHKKSQLNNVPSSLNSNSSANPCHNYGSGPTYGNIGCTNLPPNQNGVDRLQNRWLNQTPKETNKKMPVYANTNRPNLTLAPVPPPANTKPSLVLAPNKQGANRGWNSVVGPSESSLVASLTQRFEKKTGNDDHNDANVSTFRSLSNDRSLQQNNGGT